MKMSEILNDQDADDVWSVLLSPIVFKFDKLYDFVIKSTNNMNLPPEIFDDRELLMIMYQLTDYEQLMRSELDKDSKWIKKLNTLSDYLKG
jgi:hypothetical protein